MCSLQTELSYYQETGGSHEVPAEPHCEGDSGTTGQTESHVPHDLTEVPLPVHYEGPLCAVQVSLKFIHISNFKKKLKCFAFWKKIFKVLNVK